MQDGNWLYLVMEYLPGGDVMVHSFFCGYLFRHFFILAFSCSSPLPLSIAKREAAVRFLNMQNLNMQKASIWVTMRIGSSDMDRRGQET